MTENHDKRMHPVQAGKRRLSLLRQGFRVALLPFALVALVAWFVGRRMRVATRTPGLDSGRALR